MIRFDLYSRSEQFQIVEYILAWVTTALAFFSTLEWILNQTYITEIIAASLGIIGIVAGASLCLILSKYVKLPNTLWNNLLRNNLYILIALLLLQVIFQSMIFIFLIAAVWIIGIHNLWLGYTQINPSEIGKEFSKYKKFLPKTSKNP